MDESAPNTIAQHQAAGQRAAPLAEFNFSLYRRILSSHAPRTVRWIFEQIVLSWLRDRGRVF